MVSVKPHQAAVMAPVMVPKPVKPVHLTAELAPHVAAIAYVMEMKPAKLVLATAAPVCHLLQAAAMGYAMAVKTAVHAKRIAENVTTHAARI